MEVTKTVDSVKERSKYGVSIDVICEFVYKRMMEYR